MKPTDRGGVPGRRTRRTLARSPPDRRHATDGSVLRALVIDRALAMEWVTTERAARWPAAEHKLLERGRENVHAGGRLRTTVLAAPIVAGPTGFEYLEAMVRVTISMYTESRHPLLPRVYHWDPDTMDMMGQVLGAAPIHIDDHRLTVIVNPAFQESQQALGR